MNEKEAELIGMHTGDGTMYKTNSGSIVWELRGSIHEQEYYAYVANLLKGLLDVEMKPKFRGPNSYGIQTTNKVVTKFFTDNGFKSGCKTYTVRISEDIKSAPKNIQLGFIRGLFDTDGCIRFDKNRTLHYYYPRIEFGFASENLTNDLHLLFDKLEFKSYRWKQHRKDGEAFSICLAGFANLEKWIKEVKPANDKHNKRIELGLLNKSKVNLKKCSTNL